MRKSLVPRVFGILSIIFSCLVFVMVLLKSLSMVTYTPQLEGAVYGQDIGDTKATQQALVAFYEATRVPKAVTAGSYAIMSLVLFLIGLGQLRYRPWALRWTWIWSAAGLVVLFATGWIEIGWIQPKALELQAALAAAAKGGGQQAQMMAMVAGIMTGSTTLALLKMALYLPYPIILLIYFTRARVKASLRHSGTERHSDSHANLLK